jgi:hypothetical protein
VGASSSVTGHLPGAIASGKPTTTIGAMTLLCVVDSVALTATMNARLIERAAEDVAARVAKT